MGWRLTVPATIANLGPGFDILALAISLFNEVEVETLPHPGVQVESMDGRHLTPTGDDNLIRRSYRAACHELGIGLGETGVRMVCIDRIPVGRGLGSSAAAIVSGVAAAHLAHGDGDLDRESVLACATAVEGHPDNVAASLFGGMVICAPLAPVATIRLPRGLRFVVFVPARASATREARLVVPTSFSRDDALFNAGRCALLVRAMALNDPALLAVAMQDCWHQPYRMRLFPALDPLIAAAVGAGAHGAALSGAGPSVFAITSEAHEESVTCAMTDAAGALGVAGKVMAFAGDNEGLTVEARV